MTRFSFLKTMFSWGILSAFLLLAGCSSGGEGAAKGRPKTAKIAGTVTLDGKPVEGATVVFQTADGQQSASGTTDAAGHYVLTTFGDGDGAVLGEHKVAVSKWEAPKSQAKSIDDPGYNPTAAGASTTPPKNLLPTKFADANTSGLKATVTDSPENKIDFDLK